MLFFILGLLVAGLVVGAIARFLVPGPDPMGCLGTALLGIVGSIVGGFLWNLFAYHSVYQRQLHPVGLIGSVIGAVVLLLILRLFRGNRRRHW
jgi:uncharacterized membrane protein YeaQ/YmgE (transglycosylase-associated protein family)